MIEYWHWHTLHFGAETYWGGILPHSGRPGRVYGELARLGAEFERAGDLVAGITPDADIAMVYSAPSRWLMQKYPPLAGPDGGPDGVRTRASSSRSTEARSRRGTRYGSCTPVSCTTRAANART